MKPSIKLASLIGIALFIFILFRINPGDLLVIFSRTLVPLLLLAITVNFGVILLKSLKWMTIVNTVKPDFTFRDAIRAFLVGFAFSTLTPAKLGDFVKVFYIADETCGWGKALSTIVIDRLIDVILLVSIAFLGLYAFSVYYHIHILSIGTLLVITGGILSGVIIVINRSLLSALLRPFFNLFVPIHLKDRISLYYDEFFTGLYAFSLDRQRFFLSIFIGIIAWIPPFFYGDLLARSLGIDLGLFFFILVIPVISLLDLLPISISGIGTRDLALIFLFGLKGISAEQAIAFSLLYLFMSYWLIALLGAAVYYIYPIKMPGSPGSER